MARVHLFEFEDQRWFPALIRNYMTDYLRFAVNALNLFAPAAHLFGKGLKHAPNATFIDLCSGGGGAWLSLLERIRQDVPEAQLVLTDYYPNHEAFEFMSAQSDGLIRHHLDPVDARNVPTDLVGMRTQLTSFHHFRPAEARLILQNAVDQKVPLGIFEGQERSIANFVMFLGTPLLVLLATPFIRPFRFSRIIYTYLVPLVPLCILWDGLVSVLRTYTPAELDEMTRSVEGHESYQWESGRAGTGPIRIPYLLGYPKEPADLVNAASEPGPGDHPLPPAASPAAP